uniref:Cell division protein FtsA n=1 Tax=candidate division WOR-3 bacterium TaxID=2052148 RepID=A0A7C4YQN1_UNCW3
MAELKNLITGLDVGTTKIATVIARPISDNIVEIIGVGTSKSEGLKAGTVVNLNDTVASIKTSVALAERIAGVKVEEVYVGISGKHIKTIESEGTVSINSPEKIISEKDVEKVLDNTMFNQPGEILHIIPREFIIDKVTQVKNPVGMIGNFLQVKASIVKGELNDVQNMIRCVELAGLKVKDLVLQSLASSYSVLDNNEKELGVILIDIGGGTTDTAIFYNGALRSTYIVPYGGENITIDIAKVVKTTKEAAEEIKLNYGVAMKKLIKDENAKVTIPGISGREPFTVPQSFISEIIHQRLREILEFVYREVKANENIELLSSGIVLTGGTAKMKGIAQLAEEIFGTYVKIGIPERDISGLKDSVHSPAFATSVGLVKYAMAHPQEKEYKESRNMKKIVETMKKWFKEFFTT